MRLGAEARQHYQAGPPSQSSRSDCPRDDQGGSERRQRRVWVPERAVELSAQAPTHDQCSKPHDERGRPAPNVGRR